MDARPTGFFDSGTGGLGVLRAFRRLAPAEHTLYFADTAFFPYGPRDPGEVRKRSFAIAQRLIEGGAKLIVVACNTASAAALTDLREAFDVPFVGMVPGLKPAAQASRSRCVAILATEGTLDGQLYMRVKEEFGQGATVINVPGEGLAELVERGEAESLTARASLRDLLGSAVRRGADTIVLGCTHYHFLQHALAAEFPAVAVIDTTEAVARRAQQVLHERGLEAPPGQNGELRIIVSGDREAFRSAMIRLGFEQTEGVVA